MAKLPTLFLNFRPTLVLVGVLFSCGVECQRKMPNGDCPVGTFPCNSSLLCVPQRHWCDDAVHCPDGSDEASCVDEPQHHLLDKQFRKRPGAIIDELPAYCHFAGKQAMANNSSDTEARDENLEVLPDSASPENDGNVRNAKNQGCRCLQRNIICRHLHLQLSPPIEEMFELEKEIVELLDLSGNNFAYPDSTTFASLQNTRIRNLVLKHCQIKSLLEYCFDGLLNNHLEELHLDGNHLTHLHDKLFKVQHNYLRLLSIGHNSITSIDPDTFGGLDQLIELDLSNNKIEKLNAQWFASLYNLTTLKLQGNLLTQIEISSWLVVPLDITPTIYISSVDSDAINKTASNLNNSNNSLQENDLSKSKQSDGDAVTEKGLANLATLSLANNKISRLEDEAFADAPMRHSLINLDLSGNRITTLLNRTFKGLASLRVLKLNLNSLEYINEHTFQWMPNLTSLDLQNNNHVKVSSSVFTPLTELHYLYFDSFAMCANAPLVKVCEPKGDGISSKEHLLDSIILRTSVWIMALIGFVGNSIVILGRQFVTRHSNVVDSLHIKNLAISDLLMSLYLFSIASVDEYYRGEYLLNEFVWRHSNWCTLSGFLNTLSCESSVLILTLVTWDRFRSVTRPFPRNQLSFKFVALRLVALWIIAAVIAILPMLGMTHPYFGYDFYNSNGVCLPLYLHNPYGKGWQYSIAMFVFINLSALAFICYAYLRMIKTIRVSTVACRSTQQTQDRERVAQHLGIIVFTDCLCWVPIIAIKMATLAGLDLNQTYRNFVYASLAIYIMPINSALNPILYTFATPTFKKQAHKVARMCCRKQRRGEGHSGYDTALSLSMGMLGSNGRKVLTYRSTQTSHTGSKNSWRKQPQAV